jgi:hypothetical protein
MVGLNIHIPFTELMYRLTCQFSLFKFLPQAMGNLNVRWAHDGIVTTDDRIMLGVIQQIGELGTALVTRSSLSPLVSRPERN